jgi:hypothetical protein
MYSLLFLDDYGTQRHAAFLQAAEHARLVKLARAGQGHPTAVPGRVAPLRTSLRSGTHRVGGWLRALVESGKPATPADEIW